MKKIMTWGAMLSLAVGLAACDGARPVEPAAIGPLAPAMDVQASVVSLAGLPAGARAVNGFIKGSDVYGAACGGGQGLLITSTGVGTVTHFGKAVMVSTTCVNMTDYSAIGDAPYTLTAANGDQVGGLLTNVVYTAYGFDMYTSITWGTGRFEGATGELVWPTNSSGTGVWTSGVEGWIIY
jgi:hypothetical protein